MTEAERDLVLNKWNATTREYPQRSIAELFEDEVRRRPDAVALVFGNEEITYGELNRRANRLAHCLRTRNILPDTPVGLCVERSGEMVVALLGILKAGGAYVALDPTYPKERLALMLANADVPVLVADDTARDRLPEYKGSLICFEQERAEIERLPDTNLDSEAGLDHLAYISYTSGSTGVPKGVAIPHRGVVRLVKAGGFAKMDESETFLQMAPLGFDASTFETWGCLLNGGRLVVMPPSTPSLEDLGQAVREKGVTTLWLTAGLFHLMVDERLEDLRGLRQLLAGGDVLSPTHVRRAIEGLPDCQLINGYGPTENTTFTCCHAIDRNDTTKDVVPIGRPVGNTTVYLLDEKMEPVSVGSPGELYIGGDGLARGYWRQPGQTAEKFVANPFSKKPNSRLFKSSDLGRWRADGVIEFLGRADTQVKISGHRVELGEIESTLRRYTSVRDSVVVTRERDIGRKDFVAYYIPAVEPGPSAKELREFLRQNLPGSMIPVDYVAVEAFPLTSNGKIDRVALLAIAKPRASISSGPQTDLERTISAIWQEVIGTAGEIEANENFFDLGGNSLAAVEVHSRLVRALHHSFPLTALFQYPTIHALAVFLDAKNTNGIDFAAINDRGLRQRSARAHRRERRVHE